MSLSLNAFAARCGLVLILLMALWPDAGHAGATRPATPYESLTEWPGPYGGLPPVDAVTPENLRTAYLQAMEEKRAEIAAIIDNDAAPSFENTIIALEKSGVALDRVAALFAIFTQTSGQPEYAPLGREIAPLRAALDDEILLNGALFARIDTVFSQLVTLELSDLDERLVRVVHQRFIDAGAKLDDADRARLKEINQELAALRATFNQNSRAAEQSAMVIVEDEAELEGLPAPRIAAAKTLAEQQGKPDAWAIAIGYPSSNPVFRYAVSRDLRREVWDAWINRGGTEGPHDNRPITKQILQLRHEKAALLGFDSFAVYQTANRMVRTPEKPMQLLQDGWGHLIDEAYEIEASLREIALAEGADIGIMPWDYLYYREKLRAQLFDLDMQEVQQYLTMDNVISAMFGVAEEAYGFTFRELTDVATVSPDIRVFEASHNGEVTGVLWMDLYERPGKMPASFASQFRAAQHHEEPVLPLVALFSSTPVPGEDDPGLLSWERANVIFHEFGHNLHTMSSRSPYPSLGTYALPWDYIEVAALFHERWFRDRETLQTHMHHYDTDEPIPLELLERMEAARNFDRNFSTSVEFLAVALIDLKLHMADPNEPGFDVQALENKIIAELGMPASRDVLMRTYHAFHTFSPQYGAGVYTYYWSDALAADIASAFEATPEGLRNQELSDRYREYILEAAHTMDAEEAFIAFRGRPPQSDALLRDYGIIGSTE